MVRSLRRIFPQWNVRSDSDLLLLAESENATYLARSPDGRPVVFRLHRKGYNDACEIASEHAWIDALRAAGTIDTPAVLTRRDGTTIGRTGADAGERHVAAFAFMSGNEPAVNGDLAGWFVRLGALTARLHRQSRMWKRPDGFCRKRWTFETTLGGCPHWGDWREALGLDGAGRAVLGMAVAEIGRRVSTYGAGAERFGLIHADLRLANLLADGERLGVIDFDDCGFGWFMYDFAASVSFIEHEPVLDELRAGWVEGYRSEAPLSAEDEAMLPVFVMLRRILLTAWIASRADADTAKALGSSFTADTVRLADRFLAGASPP